MGRGEWLDFSQLVDDGRACRAGGASFGFSRALKEEFIAMRDPLARGQR
jgi:hypothetical protein